MRIYIAAPLFNDMERERNKRLCSALESQGHNVYLPQRDGNEFIKSAGTAEDREGIFNSDIRALNECDAVVFCIDGRTPDEGACFELGYAYAKGTPAICFCTDCRSFIEGYQNIMLQYGVRTTLGTVTALITELEVLYRE